MKKKITILGVIVVILAIAGYLVTHVYPPPFRKNQRVQRVSIYNANCALIDQNDDKQKNDAFKGRRCDLFLLSSQKSTQPVFNGRELKSEFSGLGDRYLVAGEGQILWNKSIVQIAKTGILINGKQIKSDSTSVTIRQDGSFTENQMTNVD
jgi:hypothetical protein